MRLSLTDVHVWCNCAQTYSSTQTDTNTCIRLCYHSACSDSKLTRMLQTSLGGNSKTLMIAVHRNHLHAHTSCSFHRPRAGLSITPIFVLTYFITAFCICPRDVCLQVFHANPPRLIVCEPGRLKRRGNDQHVAVRVDVDDKEMSILCMHSSILMRAPSSSYLHCYSRLCR